VTAAPGLRVVANSLSMSASVGVGADIESLCSKCGDVWHVVVAKVGADIVKVQCKECGGYHRYRKPGHVPGTRKATSEPAARRKTASAGSRSTSRSHAAASASAAATYQPDPSAPVRSYTMRETFRPGEQISHLRFGVGLVEQSSEPGKMVVLFSDGRRILAQAKPESTIGTANKIGAITVESEE
jgi:hypothetical protein